MANKIRAAAWHKTSQEFRNGVIAIAADARASGDPNWQRILTNEGIHPSDDEWRRLLDVSAKTMTATPWAYNAKLFER